MFSELTDDDLLSEHLILSSPISIKPIININNHNHNGGEYRKYLK